MESFVLSAGKVDIESPDLTKRERPVSYTHLAVERLRKAADQLARQERDKPRDRGPER